MSRSVKNSRIIKNLPKLMHSVLFRKLLLSWTLMLFTLMLLVGGSMIVIIQGVYVSHERKFINSCIEHIAFIRSAYDSGDLKAEDPLLLQKTLVASEGCGIFVFDEGCALVESIDEIGMGVTGAEEGLSDYLRYLFAEGSSAGSIIRLGGRNCIAAGKVVEYSGKPSEGIVCLRPIENLHRKQILLLVCVIGAMVVTLITGIIVLVRHISFYIIPFTEIAQAAIDMSYGNLNTRVKQENEAGELGLLARSFNRLSASLSQNFIQLEQERSRLVQIVNSTSNGIAVIDQDGELIQYNPALLELFSQMRLNRRHDITEDRRLMVIPDGDIWQKFDAVRTSGVPEKVVYPVNAERVLWINISPVLSAEGDKIGVVGNFQDMTELERLERTRREYVANVSHELRRPLTALQGLLEPIRDGLVTDEDDKKRYYDIMLHEIERLSRLISDMMQLSRLQSDKIIMQMEPLDISEIAMDVAESYRSDIESRGMRLTVEAPEGMIAEADADRVEQVLIVLLDNAIKFTPDGGKISISTYRSGRSVCLSVSDTGCGVAPEDLPHIFERFYKADKSHASEGTGLGLSIAGNIVEKMKGSITCESEQGKGTTMCVSLLACEAELPEVI